MSNESMSLTSNAIYLKKSIFILRDRMLKHIQGWDITKALNNKYRIFVRTFAGGKTTYMNVKPCFRENNTEKATTHLRSNDIPLEKLAESKAMCTLLLVQNSVSSVIQCNDKCSNKLCEVNSFVKTMCSEVDKSM